MFCKQKTAYEMRISDWSSDVCSSDLSASLPTVGTYLDEMPITTIQGALDIHAYDLARVEALAGPQGTLYGASSMAGTIKLVTNQPDYSSSYGAMDFELNSVAHGEFGGIAEGRSEEHTSELQSLMRISYAVFCLKKKKQKNNHRQ